MSEDIWKNSNRFSDKSIEELLELIENSTSKLDILHAVFALVDKPHSKEHYFALISAIVVIFNSEFPEITFWLRIYLEKYSYEETRLYSESTIY